MEKEKKIKSFEIRGTFLEKKNKKKFFKQLYAINENNAREQLMAIFGSKHKLKRRQIFIEEVKEVKE